MLEFRPCCEHCEKELPVNATDAMICNFECTYCSDCAMNIFENVCPNCGGNFEKRPIRPIAFVEKYPPSTKRVIDKKNIKEAQKLIQKFKEIPPKNR